MLMLTNIIAKADIAIIPIAKGKKAFSYKKKNKDH